MMIKEYRITHLADPEEDALYQWQIQIWLEPTWLERTLLSQISPKIKTMSGSCLSWEWGDGTKVGYFWRLWAHNAVRRHNKRGGTTYVNSRLNRSKDE